MSGRKLDRPGQIIFFSGVILVVVATTLGFYLASPRRDELIKPDWHQPSYEQLEAIRLKVAKQTILSENVHVLMWMVFGLGVGLTFFGLRMITRPGLDFKPEPPIGSIRDVFENPE